MNPNNPAQKSGPSVLKVLVIVGLIILVLVVALFATCAYFVASNPELRKAGSLVGETIRMGMAATNAPGTDELRKAGCNEALVMDMRQMMKMVESMDDGQNKTKLPEAEWQKALVMCQFTMGEPKLDCAQVARTYATAVANGPSQFAVMVRVQFPQKDVCSGIYAPDGTRLGDFAKPPSVNLPAEAPPESP